MDAAAICILQRAAGGPPPPLAGALAAWVLRGGGEARVLDPIGEASRSPIEGAPIFVHIDGGAALPDLLPPSGSVTFIGPGLDAAEVRAALADRWPSGSLVTGDPERAVAPGFDLGDLSCLPLTTYAGFGQTGGALRLLAGRGPRVRPVAAVLREIVYLVEMRRLGHVVFDDASIPDDWLAAFTEGLRHLPWRITWQGRSGGGEVHGASRLS